MSENNRVHYFDFRLHRYLGSLSDKFSREQLNSLAILMAQAADLNARLEEIYDRAVTLLREENVEEEMDRWSFDAIFNQSHTAEVVADEANSIATALTVLLNQDDANIPSPIENQLMMACADVYNHLPGAQQDELDKFSDCEHEDRSYPYLFNLLRLWKVHSAAA